MAVKAKIGDIVTRKSYGGDILFRIVDIKPVEKENVLILKGVSYRIEADAPESDVVIPSENRMSDQRNWVNILVEQKLKDISQLALRVKKGDYRDTSKDKVTSFFRAGKVLHLDGDNNYLDNCIKEYKKLEIDVVGKHVPEKDQASVVSKLLSEHNPDILVLTGHDGLVKGKNTQDKLESYKNSKYYIDAVVEARKYDNDYDNLFIFAGACQSKYKDIIDAGANFASSPYRVLIHALDPVLVCQKVALTSIAKIIDPVEVVRATITGYKGIGGLQSKGKYRNGYPFEPVI